MSFAPEKPDGFQPAQSRKEQRDGHHKMPATQGGNADPARGCGAQAAAAAAAGWTLKIKQCKYFVIH